MKLFIPISLIENDEVYNQMAMRFLFLGKKTKANKDNTEIEIEFKDIYQDLFPKMVADDIKMEGTNFYCEIDSAKLDEPVPKDFPNSSITIGTEKESVVKQKLLKDYIFGSPLIKDGKALIIIGYSNLPRNSRTSNSITTDSFLRKFLIEYANKDLSNIFTEDSIIATKKEEFAPATEDYHGENE